MEDIHNQISTLDSSISKCSMDFRSWLDDFTLDNVQQAVTWKSDIGTDWQILERTLQCEQHQTMETISKITDLLLQKWVKTQPSYDYDSDDPDCAHGNHMLNMQKKFKRKRRVQLLPENPVQFAGFKHTSTVMLTLLEKV